MQSWKLKPTVYTGEGSLNFLDDLHNKRVFMVCDPFLSDTPKLELIVERMEKKGNVVKLYSKVTPDPPIEEVAKGVEVLKEYQANVLIAIGGGSAIDLAKGIIYFNQYITKERAPLFIAIPTTSGTGSEVTNISVITDRVNNIKYPLADDSLIPDIAVLDTDFVMSVPDKVVAYSGLDVLTHALEALVATGNNSMTDALAEKAIELVFANLLNSYKYKDRFSRVNMHEASCLAGIAFNAAGLGINHAIAHQLGGQFNLVHGLANVILLPHVLAFNSKRNSVMSKYAQLSRKLGLSNRDLSDKMAVDNLIVSIQTLADDLDCEMSLVGNGISRNSAEKVAIIVTENAYSDITSQTNPIRATRQDLLKIYHQII